MPQFGQKVHQGVNGKFIHLATLQITDPWLRYAQYFCRRLLGQLLLLGA